MPADRHHADQPGPQQVRLVLHAGVGAERHGDDVPAGCGDDAEGEPGNQPVAGRPARRSACAEYALPPPSEAPTRDCAAMANESSSSADRFHSCMPIWCAASWAAPIRPATPAAVMYDAWNADARSTRSRLTTQLAPHHRPLRPRAGRAHGAAPRRSRRRPPTAPARWPPPTPAVPSPPGRPATVRRPPTARSRATTMSTGVRVSCTPRSQPFPASTSRMPGSPRIAIRSHDSAAGGHRARRRRRSAGSPARRPARR